MSTGAGRAALALRPEAPLRRENKDLAAALVWVLLSETALAVAIKPAFSVSRYFLRQ